MSVINFRSSGSSRLLVDSEKEKSLLLLKLFPLALSRRLSLQLSSIMGALPFPQRGESCSLNHGTAFRLKAYNLPVQDLDNLQDQRIEKTGKQSPLWKIHANLRTGTGCLQRPPCKNEQQHCQAYSTYPSKRELPHVTLAGLSFAFAGRGICKLCIQLSPLCAAVDAQNATQQMHFSSRLQVWSHCSWLGYAKMTYIWLSTVPYVFV